MECGTFSRTIAVSFDRAAVISDNAKRNGKPQASPLAVASTREERFEQMFQDLVGHSATVVLHTQIRATIRFSQADIDDGYTDYFAEVDRNDALFAEVDAAWQAGDLTAVQFLNARTLLFSARKHLQGELGQTTGYALLYLSNAQSLFNGGLIGLATIELGKAESKISKADDDHDAVELILN